MVGSVSVVIPSLGRVDRLRECLSAILRQEVGVPIDIAVVIDGAEADRAVSKLRSEFPEERRIKYDASPARRGSPSAKNIGASMVRGEVIVFVDDDTVPTAGWLRTILKAYDDGPAGVGGSEEKEQSPSGLRELWFKLWRDATGKVTKSGLVISNFTPRKTAREKVDCLAGANMSFLREAFEQAGGFDANYKGTAWREETDLCLRIGKRAKLLFVPDAKVLHREEQSGGNTPESLHDWNYWYHRNNTYFFLKNLDNGGRGLWIRHQAAELVLALGRMLQQRSLTPLTTVGAGTRDGRVAFQEMMRSREAQNAS